MITNNVDKYTERKKDEFHQRICTSYEYIAYTTHSHIGMKNPFNIVKTEHGATVPEHTETESETQTQTHIHALNSARIFLCCYIRFYI